MKVPSAESTYDDIRYLTPTSELWYMAKLLQVLGHSGMPLPPNAQMLRTPMSAILTLTTAVESIPIQQVTNITATVEAANSISTVVFTSSIGCAALINICSNR